MIHFYAKLLRCISTSNAIAYRYYSTEFTYGQLYELMLKFNSVFQKYEGVNFLHFTSKGFASYAAIYANLLSGNAWVPINQDIPEERLLDIIEMVAPKVVICDRPLPDKVLSVLHNLGVELLDVAAITARSEQAPFELKAENFLSEKTAYVMFTSGSTGKPKGVPMSHRNYIHFVEWALENLPIGHQECFSDYHDFSFDISIFYLFCAPFKEGAISPALNPLEKVSPVDHIRKNQVTVCATVPSTLSRIKNVKLSEDLDLGLKILFVCGEPFRIELLRYILQRIKPENVYNFYGLTETGVENFFHKCHEQDLVKFERYGYVPIGLPLPYNRVKIGDNSELLISGAPVTSGYLGGIGKDRFIELENTTWFLTGDKVELKEGVFFCKGRLDTQIKYRGYRIDLMDVEHNLRRAPFVRDAVCYVKREEDREVLVAVLESTENIEVKNVRNFLRHVLPDYMIPSRYFVLNQFPTNQSGKIDRASLKVLHQAGV